MDISIKLKIQSTKKDIPIIFVKQISQIGQLIDNIKFSNKVIFTDRTVYSIYKGIVDSFINDGFKYIFDSGEGSKSIESYIQAVDFLLQNNIDRKSCIVAIGGGVIGDVSGFVASTYKRGIKLIHIPTTLLAMADSSVGGKTGINYKSYKNQIGTFYQPEAVIICPEFLKTLPRLEMISGFGEVIKYAFTLDKSIFSIIDKYNNLDKLFNSEDDLLNIIYKSIKCKVDIVEKDEKEAHLREVLNFGHTVGHAFESYFNFELPHGIYVIFGMIVEMIISHLIFNLDLSNVNRLIKIAKNISLSFPKDFDSTDLISIIKHDKKNIKNQIRMVLLKDIEEYQLGIEVEDDIIDRALEIYKEML